MRLNFFVLLLALSSNGNSSHRSAPMEVDNILGLQYYLDRGTFCHRLRGLLDDALYHADNVRDVHGIDIAVC